MNRYEVTGYTKTGMYTAIVEAADAVTALRKGRPQVRKLNPLSRILRWSARLA